MSKLDRDQVVSLFRSRRCRCGQRKSNGQAFCRDCCSCLPVEIRGGLLLGLGRGLVVATNNAIDYLDGNGGE